MRQIWRINTLDWDLEPASSELLWPKVRLPGTRTTLIGPSLMPESSYNPLVCRLSPVKKI